MKLAIVHDYLNQFGGAERVVAALNQIWPEAPIYTSIYDQARLPEVFRRMDIHLSFMQNLPLVSRIFRWYFMIYPLAFESFDLRGYEAILSSSSAWAKGVRKQPGQLHICYCYTPMRFVWRYDDYVKRENFSPLVKALLTFLLEPIKRWDLANVPSVDHFIAISQTIAKRIRLIYGRESDIIYPPVDVHSYGISPVDKDYFLVVSRLNTYKRLDLVVEAFNQLGLPLKIIGTGPDRQNLQRLAKDNIEFLGQQSDEALATYYQECRALIFPGEEDFGMTPVEAMAAGRPVIAYRAGGATETVVEGVSGLFFDEQTPAELIKALKRFQFELFDKKAVRAQALKFDQAVFKKKIKEFVEGKLRERR